MGIKPTARSFPNSCPSFVMPYANDHSRKRWPPAMAARLTTLWNENITAEAIHRILAAEFKCYMTREMVLGKAHRLGLPKRRSGSGHGLNDGAHYTPPEPVRKRDQVNRAEAYAKPATPRKFSWEK